MTEIKANNSKPQLTRNPESKEKDRSLSYGYHYAGEYDYGALGCTGIGET